MKWILALIVAAALAFGIYQWKAQGPQPLSNLDASENSLADYAPADTAFYFSASADQAMADFMAGYYAFGTPGQQAQLVQQGIDATASKDTPIKSFTHYLLTKFQAERDGSIASIMDFFGLSSVGSAAFYTHGLMPVFKLPLKESSHLNQLLEEASQESGLTHQPLTLEGKEIKTWPITDETDDIQVSLALFIDGQYATVTLLKQDDPEELKKERLGITKPTRTLADSGELAQIRKDYNFINTYSGLVHFERIANALTKPDSSLLGRELQAVMSMSKNATEEPPVSAECAADFAHLASSMPRLVFGYKSMEIVGENMISKGQTILELTSQPVLEQFQKIRGHITQHATDSSDKTVGLAYGIDLANVTPAATALWTQFTSQTFTCPKLVELQEQAKQSSPAMLGIFLGMVQGIKGVAFSLYDVEFADSPMPTSVSALLSIAANNPASVAAMATMAPIPELAALQIPADGTPVQVPIPMVPPSVEVFAAIKGQHLAVYMGEKGKNAAENLTDEKAETNGLFGFSMNYSKLAQLMSKVNMGQFGGFGSVEGCKAKMDMMDSFGNIDGEFYVGFDATPKGLIADATASLKKPSYPTHEVAGQYKVEVMDEYCQWQDGGKEDFALDGSGSHVERDFANACDVYKESFKWQQSGYKLTFAPSEVSERETCADDMVTENETDRLDVCFLNQVSDQSFTCYFGEPGEEPAILRYTKQ